MNKIRINTVILFIFTLTTTGFAMAYEEPKYKIIKTYKEFEIRKYDDRLAVEIEYSNEDSGFRYLFKYIAEANTNSDKIKMTVPVTQSVKIDMTAPVTQSVKNDKMLMQFFAFQLRGGSLSQIVIEGRVMDVPKFHVLVSKLDCWCNFIMVLHGFS